jgi:hypothetical protein
MEKKIKQGSKSPVPKMYRRDVRMRKKNMRGYEFTNKRKQVGSSIFNVIGLSSWGLAPIYIPKRKKLKGWQKNRA